MVMFTYKPGSRVKVENGEYIGELSNLQENIEGKWGTCVRFVFRIVGGEYDGATASVLAKDDWSPGSKLDGILRSLGVEPLEFGQEFDSNLVVGRQARVYIESEEKNGNIHNNVTKWRATKVGTAAPAVAAPTSTTAPAAPAQPAKPKPPVAAQPPINPSTGVKEVVDPPRTPTGVNVVDEITF